MYVKPEPMAMYCLSHEYEKLRLCSGSNGSQNFGTHVYWLMSSEYVLSLSHLNDFDADA